jgi:hypothetical protein
MLNLDDDEFEVTSATTTEEIKKLGMAGWTKYDELTVSGMQVHFYKNPRVSQIYKSLISKVYV